MSIYVPISFGAIAIISVVLFVCYTLDLLELWDTRKAVVATENKTDIHETDLVMAHILGSLLMLFLFFCGAIFAFLHYLKEYV